VRIKLSGTSLAEFLTHLSLEDHIFQEIVHFRAVAPHALSTFEVQIAGGAIFTVRVLILSSATDRLDLSSRIWVSVLAHLALSLGHVAPVLHCIHICALLAPELALLQFDFFLLWSNLLFSHFIWLNQNLRFSHLPHKLG